MIVVLLVFLSIVAFTAGSNAEDQVGYKFVYGVHDPHTHDHKSQYEFRDGDHVVGAYMLQEPDGTHRIVKYKSAPHTGFEAIVERIGHDSLPVHHGNSEGKGGGTSNSKTNVNSEEERSGTSHAETVEGENQESVEHKE